MPRVTYTRVAQGYRPYTNPRPLAGLRGLGSLKDLNRARGLGSLGDAVPQGGYVTYRGQWITTATRSANDIMQAVRAALEADGLHVTGSSTTAGYLATSKFFGVAESGLSFNVTLQLQVLGDGFAQPSDAGSIVDHEVYVASGQMPLSSSTSYAGGPSGSGAPSPSSSSDPNCAAGMPYGIDGSPCPTLDFTSWLEQNALWIGLSIAAVVVLPKFL